MKRLFAFIVAASLCFPSMGALAWWQSIQQVGIGTAAYSGPGDVVGSATLWYGLRAYSLAKAGTKAINLCDNAGANCTDISTNASTGKLNSPGTLGVNNCTTSGTCIVKIIYDQSGALACGGAACDSTTAGSPTLLWSCINSLPCIVFSGTQAGVNTSATLASFSTSTISAVANRTGAFTSPGAILSYGSSANPGTVLQFRQVANAVQMYQGTSAQFISNITDSNYHTFQAVFNGASSVLFCGGSAGTNCSVAGTSNAISPGATASGAGGIACISQTELTGNCSGGNQMTGQLTEVGMWGSVVFTGTQQTNMTANEYNFWGPF